MKSFSSLGQFAGFLGGLAAGGYRAGLVPTLEHVGNEVKNEVEHEIGTYQGAVGPYPATAPLSDVTIERKMREGLGMGNDPDTPLFATGEFSKDVKTDVQPLALAVEIGTNVDHIVYTELGTDKQPPRPIFGPAALRALPKVMPTIAAAAVTGIVGGAWSGLGAKAITHADGSDTAELQP